MILAIELTSEQEEQFRLGIAQHDKSQIRDALTLAVNDYIESMMPVPVVSISRAEWERALSELDEFLASALPKDAPVLSDYALSREGIYGDHP